MITYEEFITAYKELKEMGYPIGDGTRIDIQENLINHKPILIFEYEDKGCFVTIRKEIER